MLEDDLVIVVVVDDIDDCSLPFFSLMPPEVRNDCSSSSWTVGGARLESSLSTKSWLKVGPGMFSSTLFQYNRHLTGVSMLLFNYMNQLND